MHTAEPLLLDSITDAAEQARGRVIVSGSHGGLYPAYLASRAGSKAVILNDAGGGLEGAGIAGVVALDGIGMAAAAVTHNSCRIGDARDTFDRGVISAVNALAESLGVRIGTTAAVAGELLAAAPQPSDNLPEIAESRRVLRPDGCKVTIVLADSASLVAEDEDTGRIVVTGSHGGLIGGDPARALKAAAAFGVFNDAGYECDAAGTTRLPALDKSGIAAVTVAHTSARIGDAASAWETGVISCTNRVARDAGVATGEPLAEAIRRLWC
jgi:hypothetical protein